jgi:hypothetical protein
MANTKVYQWEYVDLEPGVTNFGTAARGAYLEHIAQWAPQGRVSRGTSLVATWAELGVTGTWPRAVNLWEQDSLEVLARRLEMAENLHADTKGSPAPGGAPDPAAEKWMDTARRMRLEVECKLLFPAPWSPTLDELLERRVTGGVYYHQTVQVTPRRAEDYLALLQAEGLAPAEALGMQLVGAFRTGLCNDSEAIVIWALRDFDHWASVEKAAREEPMQRWRAAASTLARDWQNFLLLPGSRSPLQTGAVL